MKLQAKTKKNCLFVCLFGFNVAFNIINKNCDFMDLAFCGSELPDLVDVKQSFLSFFLSFFLL